MSTTRTYTMRARATSKAQTRQRIITAAAELAWEKMTIEITLDDVAARAGTSVQTVLRHFGSRDDLLDAAIAASRDDTVDERRAPVGDVAEAVRIIVDHYERRGDAVVRLLAQETEPRIRAVVDEGKRLHRVWVEETFGPQLQCIAAPAAAADQLVVATDVYAWKLLRRDRGLNRSETEHRMRDLVDAILAHART